MQVFPRRYGRMQRDLGKLAVAEPEIHVRVQDRSGDQKDRQPEEKALPVAAVVGQRPQQAEESETQSERNAAELPAEIPGVKRHVVFEVIGQVLPEIIRRGERRFAGSQFPDQARQEAIVAAVLLAADYIPQGGQGIRVPLVYRRIESGADQQVEVDTEAEQEQPQRGPEEGQRALSARPDCAGRGYQRPKEQHRSTLDVAGYAEQYPRPGGELPQDGAGRPGAPGSRRAEPLGDIRDVQPFEHQQVDSDKQPQHRGPVAPARAVVQQHVNRHSRGGQQHDQVVGDRKGDQVDDQQQDPANLFQVGRASQLNHQPGTEENCGRGRGVNLEFRAVGPDCPQTGHDQRRGNRTAVHHDPA